MSKPNTPTYKTLNWPAYNKALRRRGSLDIWFDPDMVWAAEPTGKRGRQISIAQGSVAWPVTTSSVSAGWAATETGNVAGPTAYATTDKAMSPDHNLGVQMRITRKALQQSGAALEQAIRRDMSGAMGSAMVKAVFLGTGADGQPLAEVYGLP